MWSLECSQAFLQIWPSDLLFDPTWPNIELGLDFVKSNIVYKFEEDLTKNVFSRVFTNCWQTDGRTTHDGRRKSKDPKSSPWAELRWTKK